MKNNGYWQAVENLTWHIKMLSEISQIPTMRANPSLGMSDLDTILKMCETVMSPEEKKMWTELDTILIHVAHTYDENPESVIVDVNTKSIELDLKCMTPWE